MSEDYQESMNSKELKWERVDGQHLQPAYQLTTTADDW